MRGFGCVRGHAYAGLRTRPTLRACGVVHPAQRRLRRLGPGWVLRPLRGCRLHGSGCARRAGMTPRDVGVPEGRKDPARGKLAPPGERSCRHPWPMLGVCGMACTVDGTVVMALMIDVGRVRHGTHGRRRGCAAPGQRSPSDEGNAALFPPKTAGRYRCPSPKPRSRDDRSPRIKGSVAANPARRPRVRSPAKPSRLSGVVGA